jgi:hypothetical protein
MHDCIQRCMCGSPAGPELGPPTRAGRGQLRSDTARELAGPGSKPVSYTAQVGLPNCLLGDRAEPPQDRRPFRRWSGRRRASLPVRPDVGAPEADRQFTEVTRLVWRFVSARPSLVTRCCAPVASADSKSALRGASTRSSRPGSGLDPPDTALWSPTRRRCWPCPKASRIRSPPKLVAPTRLRSVLAQ